MAVDPDSAGLLGKFAEWGVGVLTSLVTGLIGLVVYLFKGHGHRITTLEDNSARKSDLEKLEVRSDTTRTEFRQSIIDLHDKIETSSQNLEGKIDRLIHHLLEGKK